MAACVWPSSLSTCLQEEPWTPTVGVMASSLQLHLGISFLVGASAERATRLGCIAASRAETKHRREVTKVGELIYTITTQKGGRVPGVAEAVGRKGAEA